MRKSFIVSMAFLGLAAAMPLASYGATVEGGSTIAGTDSLTPKARAVCDGPYVLTAEAMAACESGVFPQPLADGSRYRNTGIGAEFNTLIRQLPTATATATAN